MPLPYKVFTIYAREDAAYIKELRGQLRPLEIAGRIRVWSDREINPGVDWEQEIVHSLDTADIILILVSAAYYNSVYIHEKEIKYALARHEKGEAKVLPIILRPCSFGDDPVISRLQVLPTDGKPVTDRRSWPERDDAWLDVVLGLKRTLQLLDDAEQDRLKAIADAKKAEADAKERARADKAAADKARNAEAARQEQEAAQQREQEAQRAAQVRAAEAMREQEAAYHREHQAVWEQALALDAVETYQQYLNRFPQGTYTGDARRRIKQLNKLDGPALPWGRYAGFGASGIVLVLLFWLGAKQCGRNNNSDFIFNYPTAPVEGGAFMMGSPDSEKGRESDECQHTVMVDAFNMGKYEVTQAQWQAVMGNNPSSHKSCDSCPVENVSWSDVQNFIKTLNGKVKGIKYRLPTEAEWEYAARGGKKAAGVGKMYAGSNVIDDVAWYSDNSGSKSHAVGGKASNELGLYDMSGNVFEWCADYYKAYPGCVAKWVGRCRVIRGGGWNHDASRCRAAFRYYSEPAYRFSFVGFRLVSVSLQ